MHIITCTTQDVDENLQVYSIDRDELINAVEKRLGEIINFMPENESKAFSFDYEGYLVAIEFIKKVECEVKVTEVRKRLIGKTFLTV